MSMDPTKLFAQSQVCLFGWLISQAPGEGTNAKGDPSASAQRLESSCLFSGPAAPEEKNGKKKGKQDSGGEDWQSRQTPLRAAFAAGAWLASVHAFSCEGRYTQFRTPALFLVNDVGDDVWKEGEPLRPERFGLPHVEVTVYFARDLRFWTFERGAQIVRLDMSAGTVQRLVIDVETNATQGRRIDLVGQESTFMGRLAPGN